MREQPNLLLLDVVQCWIEHGQDGKALTSGHVCRSMTRFTWRVLRLHENRRKRAQERLP